MRSLKRDAQIPEESQIAGGDGVVGLVARELLEGHVQGLAGEDRRAQEGRAQAHHLVPALEPVGGVVLLGEGFEEPGLAPLRAAARGGWGPAPPRPRIEGPPSSTLGGLGFRDILFARRQTRPCPRAAGRNPGRPGRARHPRGARDPPPSASACDIHPFSKSVLNPGHRSSSSWRESRRPGGHEPAREAFWRADKAGIHAESTSSDSWVELPPGGLHLVQELLGLPGELGEDERAQRRVSPKPRRTCPRPVPRRSASGGRRGSGLHLRGL